MRKISNHGDGYGCAWIGELRDLQVSQLNNNINLKSWQLKIFNQKHADDGCDFAQVYCEFLSVGCSHKVCLEMTN